MNEALKGCPKCKSDKVEVIMGRLPYDFGTLCYVVCRGCGYYKRSGSDLKIPPKTQREEAIKWWNE